MSSFNKFILLLYWMAKVHTEKSMIFFIWIPTYKSFHVINVSMYVPMSHVSFDSTTQSIHNLPSSWLLARNRLIVNVKHLVQKNCLWPRYNLSNDVSNDLRGIQKHLHLNLYIKRTRFMMITQFFTGRGVSGLTLLQTVYYVTFSLDFCQAQGLLYNVVEGWFQATA